VDGCEAVGTAVDKQL